MAGSAARRAIGPASTRSSKRSSGSSDDETLLVQSGKPVGVFRTHRDAPRVLIANSNLVPKWATWEKFNELDRLGLMMYGQMTAGSWIYIGTQGIVQGTFETFAEMGRQHYGGDLTGKWILTAGLGGMGGAQPLAAVMAGAHCIAIEVQESSIEKRLATRYLDHRATSIDEALAIIAAAREPTSVGLLGNAAELVPEMLARGIRPDALTDQTSAHDPANGYCPIGWSVAKWAEMRETDPAAVAHAARISIARHVEAMLSFKDMGVPIFDYGNNIRQEALDTGVAHAFDFPGFVPAYVRPLFCRGIGPFRWVALSRRPRGHLPHRPARQGADPRRPAPPPLARHGARADRLPGPARAHLLGRPRPAPPPRPRLQRDGQERRSQRADRHRPRPSRLRLRRLAQPRDREHEGRQRRGLRLAAPQRPPQHRLGRDLGLAPPRRRRRHGYSQQAGMVIVADGSDDAARRLERVLWNDPATGVMRHADAGYAEAVDCAREQGLDLPS